MLEPGPFIQIHIFGRRNPNYHYNNSVTLHLTFITHILSRSSLTINQIILDHEYNNTKISK